MTMAVELPAGDPSEAARRRRDRYGLLLASIFAAFAMQGIASPGKWQQIVITVLLATSLVLAFWAASARPVVMRSVLLVAGLVVVFSVVEAVTGEVAGAGTRISNLLLVAIAPGAIVLGIVRSLRARGRVTVEAVFGVLCLYSLLGMAFAFLYGSIDRISGPFFAQNVQATVAKCLYFSFTTLTTVGYGDLTATTNLGHTLSVTEALLGQIYLVTVVSVLVSNLARPRPGAQGDRREL
ncbi:MAG TPA: ion channel [Solirubrobacteraceae bacterium]